MTILWTILTGVLVGAVTPVALMYVRHLFRRQRKRWARQRLINDPLIQQGAKLYALEAEGRDSPIMMGCVIERIDPLGTVIIRDGKGQRTSFEAEEFERLIWIVSSQ